MGRKRDDSGQYSEEIPLDVVLDVFQDVDIPVLTATEIAEQIDCSRPTAYNKLEILVDEGEIRKKKVGSRAVVYISL